MTSMMADVQMIRNETASSFDPPTIMPTMSRALVLLAIWACAESFTPPIRTATRRRLVVGAGPADEDDDFDFEAAYRAKVAADGGALGNRASRPSRGFSARATPSRSGSAAAARARSSKKLDPPSAAETANLLSESGWAATVGFLGLTVALAVMTQLNQPPV